MRELRQHIKSSLLDALVIFSKLHGKGYSPEVLSEGLPIPEGESSPKLFSVKPSNTQSLFSRAADRAGFKTSISKIKLDNLSSLVLPCIILLKTNDDDEVNACILESFDNVREHAFIIFPEIGEVVSKVKISDLKEEYFGISFFLKREFRFESEDFKLIDNKQKHWFWDTINNIKYIYKDVLLASLVINLFMIATPIFTMNVYDRVIPTAAFDTLWIFAIGVIVVYMIDLGLRFLRTYLLEVAGKKADIIMSSIIYEKVMDLKISVIPKPVGSFANVLKEFESIRSFMASSTISILIDMPFVFIFLFTIYFVAGNLVWVPVVSILIIVIYTLSVKQKMLKSVKETSGAASLKNGVLIESISNLETIKSLNSLSLFQHKWEEATGEIADKGIKTKTLSAAIGTVSAFVTQLNTVIIIIFGAYMVDSQTLTTGALIATVIMSGRALGPMGQVAGMIAYYQHIQSAYDSIENVMGLECEHPSDKQFVRRPAFKGEVEFKNVSFSYPGTEFKQLMDINLKIKAGEKVAILGKVGSGKSTLQKLILGFYYQDEGSVLIDGIDVKQVDPVEIRSNVSYMAQENVLFAGTARSNIMIKNSKAGDDELLEAARISCATDFINKHPKGFEMPVVERGENLSGGQAQAITLARTVLDQSKLVILDEPTKSFDSGTAQRVLKNLKEEYLKDKTLILITHTPSNLVLVDRIIIMDAGKIVKDGPREQIMAELSGKKA
ncbi:MAG: type I secretion system permease/ATPase [Epsilonproteobacteria bacterium]|nr:MAG: type I secretion system permease/ATPase [Campylobacterota bacterium]